MAKAELKLRGFVQNGKLVFDHPDIKEMIIQELEEQRFEMLLSKEHVAKTDMQRAYYFGGIIRMTCMKMEMFGGWTFDEIDMFLRKSVRSYKAVRMVNGKATIEDKVDSIAAFSVGEMSLFLEDVLNLLASLDIHPLPSEQYNLTKYSLS